MYLAIFAGKHRFDGGAVQDREAGIYLCNYACLNIYRISSSARNKDLPDRVSRICRSADSAGFGLGTTGAFGGSADFLGSRALGTFGSLPSQRAPRRTICFTNLRIGLGVADPLRGLWASGLESSVASRLCP